MSTKNRSKLFLAFNGGTCRMTFVAVLLALAAMAISIRPALAQSEPSYRPSDLAQASKDLAAAFANNKRDTAYAILAGLHCESDVSSTGLSGQQLTPGVYCSGSSTALQRQLILDAQSNPEAIFVFQIDGTFTAESGSSIFLIHGAQASHVFFQVSDSAILQAGTVLEGNILALNSILFDPDAKVSGRVFALNPKSQQAEGGGKPINEAPTGFLEICKQADPDSLGPVTGTFVFDVPGLDGPITVDVDACSKIQNVPAGDITITERARGGFELSGVTAFPDDRLLGVDLAARTATVRVVASTDPSTEVSVIFINRAIPTGFLEICKQADPDSLGPVTGTFVFDVPGLDGPITVDVDSCSKIQNVPAGDITITERARTGFELSGVTAFPDDRLLGVDLAARTATVRVVASTDPSTEVSVIFINRAIVEEAEFKVCKVAGTGVTAGTPFNFTLAGAVTSRITVRAGECSLPFRALVGQQVTITEVDIPDGFRVSRIISRPPGRITLDPDPAKAVLTVGTGSTDVEFTNERREAEFKVCKAAGAGVTVGTNFTFSLTGDVTRRITVRAGECSLPIRALVGQQVTITEVDIPDAFRVSSIISRPAGRIRDVDLGAARAILTVGTGSTDVEFKNERREAEFKVCKVAGTGVTAGTPFTFTLAGAVTSRITVRAGECSLPFRALVGQQVTITEVDIPDAFQVSRIVSRPPGRITVDLAAAKAVLTVGTGSTDVEFTNERRRARLTLCKVAGPGVTVGTNFTFAIGAETGITLAAGAGPEGRCITRDFFVGTDVLIRETIPAGVTIASIVVAPSSATVVAPNPGAGTVTARVVMGGTRVTFTNQRLLPCVFTQGFFKNHPNALPATLTIGRTTLNRAQQVAVLKTPPRGNCAIVLAHQLIAALANLQRGAAPPAVQADINAAIAALANCTITFPHGTEGDAVFSCNPGPAACELADKLDAFNEGRRGVPHCDD